MGPSRCRWVLTAVGSSLVALADPECELPWGAGPGGRIPHQALVPRRPPFGAAWRLALRGRLNLPPGVLILGPLRGALGAVKLCQDWLCTTARSYKGIHSLWPPLLGLRRWGGTGERMGEAKLCTKVGFPQDGAWQPVGTWRPSPVQAAVTGRAWRPRCARH